MPGIGRASPSNSLSTPAMIRSRLDLPEPFRPSTPILAPGKKDREMSFRICRLGGTTLLTRFMVKTYCAIGIPFIAWGEKRRDHNQNCGGKQSPGGRPAYNGFLMKSGTESQKLY